MKQVRPTEQKGKLKKGITPKNITIPLKWVWGGAILLIAGIFYFTLKDPGTPPSTPSLSSTNPFRAVPAPGSLPSVTGSKRLTLSPLPLTVENNITALYGGVESTNPGDFYEWERTGAIIPGERSSSLSKSQLRKGDRIKVKLFIKGGDESVESDPVVLENALPKVTSINIEPFPPTRRDKLTAKIEGTDADGDPVTYIYKWLKEDGSVVGNDPSIQGSLFNKKEKVILEIIPSDDTAQGVPVRTATIIANALPKITSVPASFLGKEYSYQVTAEDPDNDPLTFTLSKGPAGMTIDPKSGLIKWAFTEKDAGNHPIEIKVSDPDGDGDVQSFMLPLSFTTTSAPSSTAP